MVSLRWLRTLRRRWVAALPLVFLANTAIAQTTDKTVEYQVKAAFLLNFTKFVTWPASAFDSARAPIAICVMGKDPFGRTLDEIVQGETVGARSIVVLRINRPPAPRMCQVLFVDSEEKDLRRLLSDIGRGVLTVGEGDKFLQDGGMIALVVDSRRVRFDINQAAAAGAGLNLSARLLGVARLVEK